MHYFDPNEARNMPGLRLVLTTGVPGPWSEAAKGIFAMKDIGYTPVAQRAGQPNEDLVAWTGHRNAPTAVLEDEPPRSRWYEILALAEWLNPDPPLTPGGEDQRLEMVGICHELAAEDGFGWNRRLAMISKGVTRTDATEAQRAASRSFGELYGYRDDISQRCMERQVQILNMLVDRLRDGRYLVGDTLTAADIYAACFAALLSPLPDEVCPMPAGLRASYGNVDPTVIDNVDIPRLLAHRDFIYEAHLGLPLDF